MGLLLFDVIIGDGPAIIFIVWYSLITLNFHGLPSLRR